MCVTNYFYSMKPFALLLLLFCLIISCDTTNTADETVELRIAGVNFSLGLVHNSHFGRSFSTPESAYSPTITFEVYLTEETDYLNISSFAILDEESEGWVFDSTQVREAYREESNSLILDNLELRKFDQLSRKQVSAQFLDANGEVIRERVFTLDNDFPLPAFTDIELLSNDNYQLTIDFYSTPYDGGNVPFPVTIYNTYFSSNTILVSWTDANGTVIQEDFIDKNTLTKTGSDVWTLTIDNSTIPGNAEKIFTTFRRGSYSRGGVLYTELISLP